MHIFLKYSVAACTVLMGFNAAAAQLLIPERSEKNSLLKRSEWEGHQLIVPGRKDLPNMSRQEAVTLAAQYRGLRVGELDILSADASPKHNAVAISDAPRVALVDRIDQNHAVATTFDNNGEPTDKGKVALIDPQNNVVCFNDETIPEALQAGHRLRIDFVMDQSGSMANVLGDVKAATLDFIKALPAEAECRVTFFNHGSQRINAGNGNEGYAPCEVQNFDFSKIKAEGSTNPATVIFDVMEALQKPPVGLASDKVHMSGVVILTDGHELNAEQAEILRNLQIPTFGYLIGNIEAEIYDSFIDELRIETDQPDIAAVFTEFRNRYVYGRLLSRKDCQKIVAQGGAP